MVEAVVASSFGGLIIILLGTALVVREFRRRDRKESQREIDECQRETHQLRRDLLAYRRWAYRLVGLLSDRSIEFPPAPEVSDDNRGTLDQK